MLILSRLWNSARAHRRPTVRRGGKLTLVAAAALAAPLLTAAPTASAGDVNWRVTIGSKHSHSHHRGGYYKSVWRPPVYRTHYEPCGRSYPVVVRRGYYDRVWVSAPRRHVTYHSDHYPRHQRYDSKYRRRGCW